MLMLRVFSSLELVREVSVFTTSSSMDIKILRNKSTIFMFDFPDDWGKGAMRASISEKKVVHDLRYV